MKKTKKEIITRVGRVQDLEFDPAKKVVFKTINRRKFLCSYGERTYEWAVKMYGQNRIALCYEENGITTLIAEVK